MLNCSFLVNFLNKIKKKIPLFFFFFIDFKHRIECTQKTESNKKHNVKQDKFELELI